MNIRTTLYISAVLILLGAALTALADVPQLINYQGILLDTGGNPVTAPVNVVFAIWDAETDGDSLWSEEQLVSPDGSGRFNVLLGSGASIPDSAFAGPDAYLSVKVGADPEMSPRRQIVSVGYSYRVSTVDGSSGGYISGDLDVSGKVTIGFAQTNTAEGGFVAGLLNTAVGNYSTIPGGSSNNAQGELSAIGGGIFNEAIGPISTIGGGQDNIAEGDHAVVAGGWGNRARGSYSVVGGGGGSVANDSNLALGTISTVAGGRRNLAGDYGSTVGGGVGNSAEGLYSSVGAGHINRALGSLSWIGGGEDHEVSGSFGVITGGYYNYVSETAGAIGGGAYNRVEDEYSCIPGGEFDTVTGSHSLAFGRGVRISNDYFVVFFDGDNPGRFRLNRDRRDEGLLISNYPIHVGTNSDNGNGAHLTRGGTWTNASSRAKKNNFETLEGEEVLARLAVMPVTAWQYIGSEERHIGPVAEDFVAAFDVGSSREDGTRDNQHLSHGDIAGVALMAIKQLTRRNTELESRVADLERRIEQLLKQQ